MKKITTCKESKNIDFLSFMQKQVREKKARNKIKTSENYLTTLHSFTQFLSVKGKCQPMGFEAVTDDLITSYENYLRKELGISKNSSSLYIRTLHAAYKKGVSSFNMELRDPFENAYTGVDKTRKRAVDVNVVVKLMECEGLTRSVEFSRDTFVFCFLAQGMPFIDFAKLKKENLLNGRLSYTRSKTDYPISIKINPIMEDIIDKYASPLSDFLFPVMKTEEFRQATYNSALRLYNYHLKTLSDMLGGNVSLSSYVPRHSWASEALRLHVPVRVISKSMGHTNEKTTSIYLASMDYRDIDDATRKIFNAVNKREKARKPFRKTAAKTAMLSYSVICPRYYYSISTQETGKAVANTDRTFAHAKKQTLSESATPRIEEQRRSDSEDAANVP